MLRRNLFDLSLNIRAHVAINQTHSGHGKIVINSSDNFWTVLAHKVSSIVEHIVKEVLQSLTNELVSCNLFWQSVQPTSYEWFKTNTLWLHVHHTTSGYSGWGCDLKIFDFEHHSLSVGELDDLTRIETKLLVIVEDGVHVLNPESIHRTIEHDPSSVLRLVPGSLQDQLGNDSVLPLEGSWVHKPEELSHGDGLGVKYIHFDIHKGILSFKSRNGSLQSLPIGSLSTAGGSHNHETVTHKNCIIQLNDLDVEVWNILQIVLFALLFNGVNEASVFLVGLLNSWEQIHNDILEEREIRGEEFGHIHITKSSEKELIFIHVWVFSLQASSSIDNRTHGSHSIIIMGLGGELL